GPTLRCFEFGARQRPNGQLSMSAGMNAIVDHYLSLASLRHIRIWTRRYLANHKSIRLRLDWRGRARERDANRKLMDAFARGCGADDPAAARRAHRPLLDRGHRHVPR